MTTGGFLLEEHDLTLHHDTRSRLGMGVADVAHVARAYHSARENRFAVGKSPGSTNWRGTPLHELWLKDPDGALIEICALLTEAELAQMPTDPEPVFLIAETCTDTAFIGQART